MRILRLLNHTLTLVLAVSCSDRGSKDRLFKILYHQTFIPQEGVTIEFIDSTSYLVRWGPDSAEKSKKEIWSIESRLAGTYLIMNSSDMRLETLSDSVITFSQ